MKFDYDFVIVGAGAAGLIAALSALRAGKSVALIDSQAEPARKLLITGGGRCNFTNANVSADKYVSQNPHFCKSALARLPVADVLDFCRCNALSYTLERDGKYFASSAKAVRDLLLSLASGAGAKFLFGRKVSDIAVSCGGFSLTTQGETLTAARLLIATGGLSVSSTGASDFAFRAAQKFGLTVAPLSPALTPMLFDEKDAAFFGGLSGVSCDVSLSVAKKKLSGALLFTHTGISGPAVLQASLFRAPQDVVRIDFAPSVDVFGFLKQSRSAHPKRLPASVLTDILPKRLAEAFARNAAVSLPVGDLSDKVFRAFDDKIKRYAFVPRAQAGYDKAEVTKGGVDTSALSSQTMECRAISGLYFAGECVDVTGMLGGYNLHWAFASGRAAGLAAAQK